MKKEISILVVDDNAMLRFSLRGTIMDEEDMQLMGEAVNGEEALERYRHLQPDIVTMDVQMPVLDGFGATRRILGEFPDAQIVFLSISDEEEVIRNARESGARGYLPKTLGADRIVSAIREVADGNRCFPV